MRLFDMVFTNPFVTVTSAAEKLGIAFTTAQRTIDVLAWQKIIVQRDDAKRGRVYVAEKLLRILDAPAVGIQSKELNGQKRKRR